MGEAVKLSKELRRVERHKVQITTNSKQGTTNAEVWLNRNQIAALFDRDVKTIGKHINNAIKEELSDVSVIAKFATTALDGKTYQRTP